MARRKRSFGSGGRYRHPDIYKRLLLAQCKGETSPPFDLRVLYAVDMGIPAGPGVDEVKAAKERGRAEAAVLFEERLAAGEPITASWTSVVHPSNPGAGDGIITLARDPLPHPMFENREGRFKVLPDAGRRRRLKRTIDPPTSAFANLAVRSCHGRHRYGARVAEL